MTLRMLWDLQADGNLMSDSRAIFSMMVASSLGFCMGVVMSLYGCVMTHVHEYSDK